MRGCQFADSLQEKQRQQDQQLQRHLTRPPPQYQDQPANQNPFSQPPVNQFTGGKTGRSGEPWEPNLCVLIRPKPAAYLPIKSQQMVSFDRTEVSFRLL